VKLKELQVATTSAETLREEKTLSGATRQAPEHNGNTVSHSQERRTLVSGVEDAKQFLSMNPRPMLKEATDLQQR
jgi:hypothetical protein